MCVIVASVCCIFAPDDIAPDDITPDDIAPDDIATIARAPGH
jgi:hypothetical protein